MNKAQYDDLIKDLTEHRKGISKGKRQDYTKGSEDVLKNFKNQAESIGVTELQSLAVHMEKQMSAVLNYIKTNGQSESEPIKNRIADTINYLELLWGLINDLGIGMKNGKTYVDIIKDNDGHAYCNDGIKTCQSIKVYDNFSNYTKRTKSFNEEGHVVKNIQQKETGNSFGI